MHSPEPSYVRSTELLSRHDSRLLIVDVQEKLIPKIEHSQQVVANCRTLVEGAALFDVPVAVTEQYPRGLGPTVPALAELLPAPIEKLRFSSAEALGWTSAAGLEPFRFQVIVAGIEAHVCILQTALDLIAAGFHVFVPADAVSSRNRLDREMALQRLAASGAVITTTESVLFEWCELSGTPAFKKLSQLVKARADAVSSAEN